MSALPSMAPADSAAAYERHISENWDRLSPFEQDQARAYMQAKFEGAHQPQPTMPSMPPQPGFAAAIPMNQMYGYGYGYGPGAFGPPKKDEGGWAVPVGYLGVLFFTPLAIYCGIYNMSKGRTGHGLAQILIPVAMIVFVIMLVVSMP